MEVKGMNRCHGCVHAFIVFTDFHKQNLTNRELKSRGVSVDITNSGYLIEFFTFRVVADHEEEQDRI